MHRTAVALLILEAICPRTSDSEAWRIFVAAEVLDRKVSLLRIRGIDGTEAKIPRYICGGDSMISGSDVQREPRYQRRDARLDKLSRLLRKRGFCKQVRD
jgi:hypothetical protein